MWRKTSYSCKLIFSSKYKLVFSSKTFLPLIYIFVLHIYSFEACSNSKYLLIRTKGQYLKLRKIMQLAIFSFRTSTGVASTASNSGFCYVGQSTCRNTVLSEAKKKICSPQSEHATDDVKGGWNECFVTHGAPFPTISDLKTSFPWCCPTN